MSDSDTISKAELITNMQEGWNNLQAYIDSLSETQLTQPTDAAGWTAKDHLIHLAVWADGVAMLLEKQSRSERMGVDAETWASRDFDRINAVIQQNNKDMPLEDVRQALQAAHQSLYGKAQAMSQEELNRPYNDYEPGSTQDKPVVLWIISDSYDHYAEHIPWIDAIVKSAD